MIKMRNKYVVGDIHGNYYALKEVLDKVNFDYENDLLITIGDLVDGWPHTKEVIELLMKVKNHIKIKGNHDEWMINLLPKMINNEPLDYWENRHLQTWLYNGGNSTLDSYNFKYIKKPEYDEVLIEHLDWLSESLNYFIDDDNNLFIHAGYPKMVVPEKDKNHYNEDYLWSRNYVREKVIYPYNNPEYKGDKNFNKVFIGHTPTLNFDVNENNRTIINNNNIYLIDTGVAFYGPLTIMDINSLEITYSSLNGDQYYPDINGRNKLSYNEYIKIKNEQK